MKTNTLSSLSLAILCQLIYEPKSGYDIKKKFEDSPMGHFSTSPGAIYPAIKRLETAGWIEGKVTNAQSLRPSKQYTLTEQGTEVLKESFATPLTREDVMLHMDQIILKFVFMTPLLERPATVRFLEQFIDRASQYKEELVNTSQQNKGAPPEVTLALNHGVQSYNMHLNWALDALKTLQKAHA